MMEAERRVEGRRIFLPPIQPNSEKAPVDASGSDKAIISADPETGFNIGKVIKTNIPETIFKTIEHSRISAEHTPSSFFTLKFNDRNMEKEFISDYNNRFFDHIQRLAAGVALVFILYLIIGVTFATSYNIASLVGQGIAIVNPIVIAIILRKNRGFASRNQVR
ncbi:hypothetical protein BC829DRAFT_302401 [Chytridium lagenaria]|nr:hypothetical protein BC829DRAFT_302401 [Chytridium lagenaria]